MTPRVEMEKELKGQEKEITDDINSLNKKVRSYVIPKELYSDLSFR